MYESRGLSAIFQLFCAAFNGSFHISGGPWQPSTQSAIGWTPRTSNFVHALPTAGGHFRSLQLGLSFLSYFFYEMQSSELCGCARTIFDNRTTQWGDSRRGGSRPMVRLHKDVVWSIFAWKATTKMSLARKAPAQKKILARKETSFSAVGLAVSFFTKSGWLGSANVHVVAYSPSLLFRNGREHSGLARIE